MNQIDKMIKNALKEDIPSIDISSEYLFHDEVSFGKFIAKQDGVISGINVCKRTFEIIDKTISFTVFKQNGDSVMKGDIIATVSGKTKSILMAERVGLNFLQRMSGIATLTSLFVKETIGTHALILDTRKTTPNLRALEKQAVLDGGGTNHRMDLSEMVMLKDNHLKAAKSIHDAVETVKAQIDSAVKIEVEGESVSMFKEAIMTRSDIIMLDNMSLEDMKTCVEINNGLKKLEASGNMTLQRIKAVASVGVDYISVGELTHSYKSLDISLKF